MTTEVRETMNLLRALAPAAAAAEYGQNAGVTGQATVTGVGDRLCAEIEYEDDQKSLTGTIGVDVTVRG